MDTVSDRVDQVRLAGLARRFWKSSSPEAAWAVVAVGNLAWMIVIPSWSMLPYHFTWMSLLLLYGFGFRTWTRQQLWWLLIPVMAATMLLFADPAIRGQQPYDEVIELPFMVALFSAMVLHSRRRQADIVAHDEVSRHNLELLERQRVPYRTPRTSCGRRSPSPSPTPNCCPKMGPTRPLPATPRSSSTN